MTIEKVQNRDLWSGNSLSSSGTISYVNYSNIAARVLRKSLKSELKDDAAKRDQSLVKVFFWANGDILPAGQKPASDKDAPKT